MKVLDPEKHVVMEIDEGQTARFEAFLDRNCPGWREQQRKSVRGVMRQWSFGTDNIIRTAFYRGQFVELSDDFIDLDEQGEAEIEFLKHRICDIDGDLTPVAVWGQRGQTQPS